MALNYMMNNEVEIQKSFIKGSKISLRLILFSTIVSISPFFTLVTGWTIMLVTGCTGDVDSGIACVTYNIQMGNFIYLLMKSGVYGWFYSLPAAVVIFLIALVLGFKGVGKS
jgi:hypothetical protein